MLAFARKDDAAEVPEPKAPEPELPPTELFQTLGEGGSSVLAKVFRKGRLGILRIGKKRPHVPSYFMFFSTHTSF